MLLLSQKNCKYTVYSINCDTFDQVYLVVAITSIRLKLQ